MAQNYSNTAVQTTLTGAITSAATSLTVAATTGFPSPNFTLVLDPGTSSEELVLVTAVAGTTLTVTRGYDGTTAVSHGVGAVVQHAHSAKDFADSRTHEAATAAHGATGAVVGTTNTQTLTNKDLSSGTNVFPTSLATLTGAQTLSNKTLASSTTFANNVVPAAALATSAITLGYTQVTANFSTASSTVTAFTGLSSSVTIPAGGRRVKITVHARSITNTVGVTTPILSLWDGAVGTGTQLQVTDGSTLPTVNYFTSMTMVFVHTPAAGAKTYNVGIRSTAGSNITAGSAADSPSFILVEAI